MFEQPAGKVEKDRSRSIMMVSGAAVLAVIVLIIVVTSIARRAPQIQFSRAGSADFDSYAHLVLINNVEKFEGERLNQRYGRLKCSVQNSGDRLVEGLEVRAAVVGHSGQVYKEKVITPVPNIKDKLAPNESMVIEIYLEPIPEHDLLSNMTVEVYGLKIR